MSSSENFAPYSLPESFVLGGVRVDPSLNAVIRDGQTVLIEPQVMQLLLFLREHADETCSRELIMESVWPESEPNEEALTQAVSKLRKALGDSERSILRTVRKVGYRLQGPIHPVQQEAQRAAEVHAGIPPVAMSSIPWRRVTQLAFIALLFFMFSRVKVMAVHHDTSWTNAEGETVRVVHVRKSAMDAASAVSPDSVRINVMQFAAE